MPTNSELKDLFFEALELSPLEREGYLSELESRDSEKRTQLDELLEAHERAEAASRAAEDSLDLEDRAAAGLELPLCMGNYELLEYIAEGGSGVVYRARQIDLGRTVAIKLLRSGLLATGEEVQRFRAEAEVSARLDHPSIVPVHEVGNYEGRHFISMKLIEGPSLDQRMGSYRDDPRAAAQLVARIARAVDHGHRHGVLHRDVKPSNVLLDKDGTPFIADFGTAKLIDGARRETLTGWILGTPSYMAPEQASASGDVTVATDVYSLGCVLYELLVGCPPLAASGLVEALRRVQEDAPTAVRVKRPEIHRDLETICHTCLEKEPARRYGSALALAEDIERWLDYEPIQARRATRLERIWLTWRRNPVVTSLAIAVGLLAVALVIGAVVASLELRAAIDDTQSAEHFAREQLRNAYLAEARALRRGGPAGRREKALELLGLAAEIRPGRDLLDEGASTLALSDIASERSWSHDTRDRASLSFDGNFERYFVGHLDGRLEVHSAVDNRLLFNLPGNGDPAWRSRLSPDGRYVGLVHHTRTDPRIDHTVIWDLQGPTPILEVPRAPEGHFDFAAERAALTLCWSDGRLHEIDLSTMKETTLAQFGAENLPARIRYSPTDTCVAVTLAHASPVLVYSLSGELLAKLEGHGGHVHTLAWSPDGSRLLAGGSDHQAYVWEIETGELVATLVGHRAEIVYSAFPRRDLVATYSWDGTTRLWDLETGQALASSDESLIESPPKLGRLALVTPERIRIGAVVHGTVLSELHGHGQKDPGSLSIDPTDSWIASGGETEVLLWELASRERVDRLDIESLNDLLFLPDGSLLIASGDGLERRRLEGGRFSRDAEVMLAESTTHLSLAPDGRRLAYTTEGFLNLSLLEAGSEPLRIPAPKGTSRLAFSADGRLVAAGSYRGSGVHVWNTSSGEVVVHLSPDDANCMPHFSSDGRWLAIGGYRDYRIHRVATWELVHELSRGEGAGSMAKVTRYSPNGEVLAGVFGRRELMLLDAASGEALAVFEPPGHQQFSRGRFTSEGRHLVVASESNRVLVWDLVRLRQNLADAGLDSGLGPGWTREVQTDRGRTE